MNRLSVVLAADSATTVTYWNGSENEVRYFKGANKIFQLSDHHAVGVMLYDSASILGVPWEVVIKDFRNFLGEKSFNTIEGYADEFIVYINENQIIFPKEIRKKNFIEIMDRTILLVILELQNTYGEEIKSRGRELLDELVDQGVPLDQRIIKIDLGDLEEFSKVFSDEISEIFIKWKNVFEMNIESVSDRDRIFILHRILKEITVNADQTGLVFAGFGDRSIFPEMVHLQGCKFWNDKFCEGGRSTEETSYEVPAVIAGFAQTSMHDTLKMGFSFDVWSALVVAADKGCKELLSKTETHLGSVVEEQQRDSLLKEANKLIRDSVMEHARAQHSFPLRRVVGMLPVDEMGELAETLINLQSLKEKVTKPSETVGGPVDVAAITRSEGMVWIKRKHYFKPEINSRFFDRRGKA